MSTSWQTDLGSVIVEKEVIAKVAGLAAMECYGLVGMSSQNVQDGLADILGWDNMTKGVAVEIENNSVRLQLNIIVEFGTNIAQVANNAMQRVKYVIQDKLGIDVEKVDINVQGVRVEDEQW